MFVAVVADGSIWGVANGRIVRVDEKGPKNHLDILNKTAPEVHGELEATSGDTGVPMYARQINRVTAESCPQSHLSYSLVHFSSGGLRSSRRRRCLIVVVKKIAVYLSVEHNDRDVEGARLADGNECGFVK